jgi:hypothetical protein
MKLNFKVTDAVIQRELTKEVHLSYYRTIDLDESKLTKKQRGMFFRHCYLYSDELIVKNFRKLNGVTLPEFLSTFKQFDSEISNEQAHSNASQMIEQSKSILDENLSFEDQEKSRVESEIMAHIEALRKWSEPNGSELLRASIREDNMMWIMLAEDECWSTVIPEDFEFDEIDFDKVLPYKGSDFEEMKALRKAKKIASISDPQLFIGENYDQEKAETIYFTFLKATLTSPIGKKRPVFHYIDSKSYT